MLEGRRRKVCALIKGFNCAIKKHEDNLFFQRVARTGSFIIRSRSSSSPTPRPVTCELHWLFIYFFYFCGMFNTNRSAFKLKCQ